MAIRLCTHAPSSLSDVRHVGCTVQCHGRESGRTSAGIGKNIGGNREEHRRRHLAVTHRRAVGRPVHGRQPRRVLPCRCGLQPCRHRLQPCRCGLQRRGLQRRLQHAGAPAGDVVCREHRTAPYRRAPRQADGAVALGPRCPPVRQTVRRGIIGCVSWLGRSAAPQHLHIIIATGALRPECALRP